MRVDWVTLSFEMSANPLRNVGVAMERLEGIMQLQRQRTPTDFAEALPEIVRLSRYRGRPGPALLFDDICAALEELPEDHKTKVSDKTWGRMILGLDNPADRITIRRRDLGEENGSARKYRDRYVIQAVMHHLQRVALPEIPSHASYDFGFDVLKTATELRSALDDPLGVEHKVTMKVRARRPGLRIVPLCYSAVRSFDSVVAQTNSNRKIDIVYTGCSALATGNPDLPIHFFWLSQPAKPGMVISLRILFSERYDDVWTEARSRLRLLCDSPFEVVLRASPPDAFERVVGLRSTPRNGRAVTRFDSGPEGEPRRNLEYRPGTAAEQTTFELRCIASKKHLDKQRKSVTQ